MAVKDRSTGWIGSNFVGIAAANAGQPAAPTTSPVQQQLKNRASGYVGSQYVGGPGLPATPGGAMPAPAPVAPAPAAPAPVSTTQVQPNQQLGPDPALPAAPTSPMIPRATEGFDQAKLNDPTNAQTHKYVGGRILAAGGGVDEVLADPKFAGWTKVGDDKIRSPEGSVYDLSRDATGANGQPGANVAQWTYVGGGPAGTRNDGIRGNDPNGGGMAGGGGGNQSLLHDGIQGNYAAGQAGAAGAAGAPGAAGAGSFQDQTRALLMAQMQGLSGPVDGNDPAIAAAMQAAQLEADRGHDLTRKDQAERMYAEGGLNSNALGQAVQQSRERGAQGLSTLRGDLMMREVTNRRQQMAQLLSQALQTGDQESARALQMQLAQMDDRVRRLSLAQQQSQHDDSYGIQISEAQRQRDLDAARAKAGLNF